MRVTLTFDNGPDPVGTPAVLDALDERHIPAVFFVVGQKARAHLPLVATAHAAGHLIGNHTWSHSIPFGEASSPGFASGEIAKTQQLIKAYVPDTPLFRPVGAAPGAVIDHRLLNEEAVTTLREGGFTMVLWNVIPHDWENPDHWLDLAMEGCRQADHAVVVLHDGYPEAMGLLPRFVDLLIKEGVDFRTDFPASCTPIRAGIVDSANPLLTAYSKDKM